MGAGDGHHDAAFNCENASEQYWAPRVWGRRYTLVPVFVFTSAPLPLTHRVLPLWMEEATTRAILLLLFTSGEAQPTSAHHMLVTLLRSAAGRTPISLVSKKGKSLTMVVAASWATSLLRATRAGTPPLPGDLSSACRLALCANDIAVKNYRRAGKNTCGVFASPCVAGS